jgi:UPF0755 protein
MKYALATLAIVVAAATALIAVEAGRFLTTPPAPVAGEAVIIDIEPGTPFHAVAAELADRGVITDVDRFRLLAVLTRNADKIRAGEFALATDLRPMAVLEALTTGPGLLHRLVVPEGLPWWEIAALVEEAGFGSFAEFEKAVHDPELLARFAIPADSAEGYLFPETYMLPKPRGDGAREIVELMLSQFREALPLVYDETPDPVAVHRDVILASIVEKETGVASERARIAGVFARRLEKGMLLQTDPTIIYGIGPDFDGNLRRTDLENSANPYNTYRHGGLPPGPICSPGVAALRAAVDPEEHAFLYFVSKGDGSHHFSKTLSEHNRAVRTYQLKR